jgi:hypothetical protein
LNLIGELWPFWTLIFISFHRYEKISAFIADPLLFWHFAFLLSFLKSYKSKISSFDVVS